MTRGVIRTNKPYHKLEAWHNADQFIKSVYRHTVSFPSDEKFGITSRLRRAAVSVALNIVEGNARGSRGDLVRFLMIARASATECSYLLELSYDLGYLNKEQYNEIEAKRNRTGFLIQKMISGLRKQSLCD